MGGEQLVHADAADARGLTREDAVGRFADASAHRTPRWVKLWGLVALVAVVALIVLLVAGGEHGPGRHSGATPQQPSGQTDGGALQGSAPAGADGGHTPPPGGHQ